MEFEKLFLQVSASKAGLTEVKPHVLLGLSGAEHRFDLLFYDGSRHFAFDLYDSVAETDVLRSYVKKLDTHASVSIVSRPERATWDARALAAEYGMRILAADDLDAFFVAQRVAPARSSD